MDETKTSEKGKGTELATPNDPLELTKLGEDIGTPESAGHAEEPRSAVPRWTKAPTNFARVAKNTPQIWLIAATVFLGFVALLVLSRVSGWIRTQQEKRHERVVARLAPDRVIAGCGQPVEDVTKEVYPIIMRTMSYKPSGKGPVVLAFSKTAEEQSDWVFLSMKDENGAMTYTTPDTQIAALPCLDSGK